MAQVAIVINIPQYTTATIGDFIDVANIAVRLIRKDLPVSDGTSLAFVAKSDSAYVAAIDTDLLNPTASDFSTSSFAGDDGSVTPVTATATGVLATSVLVSAVAVDDTTQAVTDVTALVEITDDDEVTIDGDDLTDQTVTLTWYDPAA